MPTLPLPPFTTSSTTPAAGDIPVGSSADALAVFPSDLKPPQGAPERDELLAGITAMAMRHQELAAYAAAQADTTRATEQYLDALADERSGAQRVTNEDQEAFRARALSSGDLGDPTAILSVVNAILAPVSTVQAQLFESGQDRLFISDGTASWHSFIGVSPYYPDRLYPSDVSTNGAARPQSNPGKAWVFPDDVGRFMILRVPDLASIDQNLVLVYNGTLMSPGDSLVPELGGATPPFNGTLQPGQVSSAAGGTGLYIANGSNASGSEADGSVTTFLYSGTTDSLSTYQNIVSAVERLRGASIRWMLEVDTTLATD